LTKATCVIVPTIGQRPRRAADKDGGVEERDGRIAVKYTVAVNGGEQCTRERRARVRFQNL
jgi:hypothetical protein